MKELTVITPITGSQPVNPKAIRSLEDILGSEIELKGQIHNNGFGYLLSSSQHKLRYSLVDGEDMCVCKVMHVVQSNMGVFISLLVPITVSYSRVNKGYMSFYSVSSNKLVAIKEHEAISMGIDPSSLYLNSLVLIGKDQMIIGTTGPRPFHTWGYKSLTMAKLKASRAECVPFTTNEETGMATTWVQVERRTFNMELTFRQRLPSSVPKQVYCSILEYRELELFGLRDIPRKQFLWIEIDVFGHFTGRIKH